MLQFIHKKSIQPKLEIGNPNDQYEQEADQVAARVMRMKEGEKPIQRQCTQCEEEDMMQRKEANGIPNIQADFNNKLQVTKGSGSPINGITRQFMESRMGTDFSNVRIHTGNNSEKMNRDISARAFTHGSDIYFNQNEYQPESSSGKELLAHELTHVVQQGETKSPFLNKKQNSIQRASLVSDGDFFLFVPGAGNPYLRFTDVVRAVSRRYRLDYRSSLRVAAWIRDKNDLFRHGEPRILSRDLRISLPRMVAFFQVDWVQPFNPYLSGGSYHISSEAFNKAQQMWARENIFVGFRRGSEIPNRQYQQVQFNPSQRRDGTMNRNTSEELSILSERPGGPLPRGHFHIVVTGTTTEDETATGKSVRSRTDEPINSSSEGILLFAGTYSRLGYRQTVERGNNGQELAELLAHEIGHFLFGLGHYEEPQVTSGGINVVEKNDFMRGGRDMDPNDRLGAGSRRGVDAAFDQGEIPRPERSTSR